MVQSHRWESSYGWRHESTYLDGVDGYLILLEVLGRLEVDAVIRVLLSYIDGAQHVVPLWGVAD